MLVLQQASADKYKSGNRAIGRTPERPPHLLPAFICSKTAGSIIDLSAHHELL